MIYFRHPLGNIWNVRIHHISNISYNVWPHGHQFASFILVCYPLIRGMDHSCIIIRWSKKKKNIERNVILQVMSIASILIWTDKISRKGGLKNVYNQNAYWTYIWYRIFTDFDMTNMKSFTLRERKISKLNSLVHFSVHMYVYSYIWITINNPAEDCIDSTDNR